MQIHLVTFLDCASLLFELVLFVTISSLAAIIRSSGCARHRSIHCWIPLNCRLLISIILLASNSVASCLNTWWDNNAYHLPLQFTLELTIRSIGGWSIMEMRSSKLWVWRYSFEYVTWKDGSEFFSWMRSIELSAWSSLSSVLLPTQWFKHNFPCNKWPHWLKKKVPFLSIDYKVIQ